MKESCQIPKIIKAGEKLIDVLKYKHATLSKKKKKMEKDLKSEL